MAEEPHPIPIHVRRLQTQASQLKTFDAVAPASGSAAELLALKNDCYKLIEDIYNEGLPHVRDSQLSLQTLTTLKTHLNVLAKRLNILPTPVEPSLPYNTPRPPPRPNSIRQNTMPPTPPHSPSKNPVRPVSNVQQVSRPSIARRQTTGPYSKARQAYEAGMKTGILNLAQISGLTYDAVNGWVVAYGWKKQRQEPASDLPFHQADQIGLQERRKYSANPHSQGVQMAKCEKMPRKAPFKWFFNEADQKSLQLWRKRFEDARLEDDRRGGGDFAKAAVGKAFISAHPAVYHSGRYLRLGKYADPHYPEKGYKLATDK